MSRASQIQCIDVRCEAKLLQAVKLAIEINDLPLLAKAYRHLNASCIRQNQISQAENYLTQSLDTTNQIQTSKIKEEYSEIEWSKIVAFRNFLSHEYFGVDVELIWGITQNNLGDLKNTVVKMLLMI